MFSYDEHARSTKGLDDDSVRQAGRHRPPHLGPAPAELPEPGDHGRSCASAIADLRRGRQRPAIVLRGAGDVFCGGVEARRSGPATPMEFARDWWRSSQVFPGLGKPLVGAINGDALMSGFAIAVMTDVAVAVRGARLGTIEAAGGMWPMIAQVPPLLRLQPRHALENIITGEPFPADRAAQLGSSTRSWSRRAGCGCGSMGRAGHAVRAADPGPRPPGGLPVHGHAVRRRADRRDSTSSSHCSHDDDLGAGV